MMPSSSLETIDDGFSILHLSLLSGRFGLYLEPNPTREEGVCLLSFVF
jgi:hypothetical protein